MRKRDGAKSEPGLGALLSGSCGLVKQGPSAGALVARLVMAQEKPKLPAPRALGIATPMVPRGQAVPWKGWLPSSPVLLPACSPPLLGAFQKEGRAAGPSQRCTVTFSALPSLPGTALQGWDSWGLSGSTEAGSLAPCSGKDAGLAADCAVEHCHTVSFSFFSFFFPFLPPSPPGCKTVSVLSAGWERGQSPPQQSPAPLPGTAVLSGGSAKRWHRKSMVKAEK